MPNYGDILTSVTDISRIRQGAEAVKQQLSHSGSIMMMLGPFMFAVETAAHQSLRRQTAYRWPAQDRINTRPALQFTGHGGESIELDGVIYPDFKGGLHQVQAMRELAGLGKPLPLVDGAGLVYGEWVIEQIEETLQVIDGRGTAHRIEFRLQLAYYPRDGVTGPLAAIAKKLGDG